MRLYRQTVEDFGLYTGKELSDREMDALRDAAGRMSAKMRAVRIVSASSVSKRDLEQRLVLLDDRKVAEQVVARCIAKGYGAARAKQALYEKKVPKQYWEEALADYPDQQDQIQEFLRARLGNEYGERDVKRAVDALLRRGHSYQQIRQALKQLDTEEFLEE